MKLREHGPDQEAALNSRGKLARGCWDKILLFGVAMVVCIVGCGAFVFGEAYRINPGWIFVGWNSIFLVPLVGADFRKQYRRPAFLGFFGVWMVLHGVVMAALMRWVSILYWAPFIFVELILGYFVAEMLFGETRGHV